MHESQRLSRKITGKYKTEPKPDAYLFHRGIEMEMNPMSMTEQVFLPRPAILNFLHLICSLSPKITPALACDKYLQGLVMERDTSVGDAVWLRKENYFFIYLLFLFLITNPPNWSM